MAAVQNSDVVFFPFHARLRTQSNLRTVPLGDVNARWTAWRRSDYFYPEMIPEPDYSDSESDEEENEGRSSTEGTEDESETGSERLRSTEAVNETDNKRRRMLPQTKIEHNPKIKTEIPSRLKKSQLSEEELIKPKKPANPYLESTERQKLHKELKFNQKYGKQKGNQRTELQMALEKYTEGKIRRDLAASRRSSLEKILEQQARKIEMHEREGTTDVRPSWIEQLQRQHITKRSDPKTDEFFRVHARVVNNLMNTDLLSKDEDPSTASDLSSGRSSSPSESSD